MSNLSSKASDEDALATLNELLERNHKAEHHIFYNNRLFANHSAHTLITVHALGADSNRLRELYAAFDKILIPHEPRVAPITEANWRDFLGNDM
ncbi:hypothetical protein BC938DRAFT_472977 [Jimgerdemannia flammicorona]|uniref:Uncharacterized protein n=1 Tax=Jimgerdemannia flammicorona TaxID=994334 RepID=A0A433Q521_9FUNG|nr:hypothetical protein BC938DRAFT_472977 [Jimgerdemannia flammicorona]